MSNAGAEVPVGAAVSLGWQIAELFHGPLSQGPAESPPLRQRLPGLSALPEVMQTQLLCQQIAALASSLLGEQLPEPVQSGLAKVQDVLGDVTSTKDDARHAVLELHCALLVSLQVADFRLGKAYGLGRALAETALIPAAAENDADTTAAFDAVYESGRVGTMNKWLADLKSLLPPHVAYGTAQSLQAWSSWVVTPSENTDWTSARHAVAAQGRIWRSLATGEKAAVDMLDLAGYLEAAHQIVRHLGRSLQRFWKWAAGGAALTIAVVVPVFAASGVSASVRLVTGVAWLAGVLGISMKSVSSLFSSALQDGEGWLWQTELDEAVASAASRLPKGARRDRPAADRVGAMTSDGENANSAVVRNTAPAHRTRRWHAS